MARVNALYSKFNRGEVSPWALARVDKEYLADSCETMTNWKPMRLGPMMYRPGSKYLGTAQDGYLVPFHFGSGDTALLEFYNGNMRIWDGDALITRPTVSATVSQQPFTTWDLHDMDTYQWTLSASGTNEYYIELNGGGNPAWPSKPEDVYEGDVVMSETTLGSLAAGEWDWGDNDSLGFSTIYVRTSSGVTNPTTAVEFDELIGVDDSASWNRGTISGTEFSHFTNGKIYLTGDGTQSADRTLTLSITEQNTIHALRFTVEEAPLDIKIGTTSGGREIYSGEVGVGTHSLAFIPEAATIYVVFTNTKKFRSIISACAFDAAGTLTLPHDMDVLDIKKIRIDQSADVVYVACEGKPPLQIERRAAQSWSIVEYRWEDGPYNLINTTPITITPSATTGNVTLTASEQFWNATNHVGCLIQLESDRQQVGPTTLSAENTFTGYIRVQGVGDSRDFRLALSWGAGTGTTVTMQRSLAEPGAWEDADVDSGAYGDPDQFTRSDTFTSKKFNDGLDNQIVYYRLGIKTGGYGSDNPTITITYSQGSIIGQARIWDVESDTIAHASVEEDLGSTDPMDDWYISEWSAGFGYPTAVALYEGRLWWAGNNKIWGTESDAYDSFDVTVLGDSKALRRTIGSGPVNVVNWLFHGERLVLGTAGNEISVRSTGFTEALTALNANIHEITTQGSSSVDVVKVDDRGFFVQAAGTRVFEIYTDADRVEHSLADTMLLHPEIGTAYIKRIAISRQPETRLYAVLNDGTMIVMLEEPSEEVRAWYRITTEDGTFEDVCVLPTATNEDDVYVVVNRTNERTLEKFAATTECRGASRSKCLDSFVEYTSPGTALSGLDHLDGLSNVRVWADGEDRGTVTVSGGAATLAASYTDVVVGLGYTATWKSFKLAWGAENGTALTQKKRVERVSLVLKDYAPGGLTLGPDSGTQTALPGYENGNVVGTQGISTYDEPSFEFEGGFDSDSRVVIQATAPVTVLGMVVGVDTDER